MISPYVLIRVGARLQTSEAGEFLKHTAADTTESWSSDHDSSDWPLRDAWSAEQEWRNRSVVSFDAEQPCEQDGGSKEQATTEVRPFSSASIYHSIFSDGTSMQTFTTAKSKRSISGLRQSVASHLTGMR